MRRCIYGTIATFVPIGPFPVASERDDTRDEIKCQFCWHWPHTTWCPVINPVKDSEDE